MKKNIGIVAFVLSIIGFFTGCFFVGIVLDIIAIILGIQLRNKQEDRKLAIAAIVISIIGIVFTIFFYFFLMISGTHTASNSNASNKTVTKMEQKAKPIVDTSSESTTQSTATNDTQAISKTQETSTESTPTTESTPVKEDMSEVSAPPTETTMYAQRKVNVRSKANTSSISLGYLSVNDAVIVIGNVSDDGWYTVTYNNQTGYIKSDYLGAETVVISKITTESEKTTTKSSTKDSNSSTSSTPSTEDEANRLAQIDTNRNGKVTIAEAKAAGYTMPIYSSSWLYKYMDDRDHDGEVGEN